MPAPRIDVDTFLAIDLGSIHTRVSLFDVVNGEYRYIATGSAPSTIDAPYNDVEESVHRAILHLQEVSGRLIINNESQIVVPTNANGVGADRMVMSFSGGPEIRVVVAGLLQDVSLGSALRLAQTAPVKIVDTIGIHDKRKPDALLDSIIKNKTDLIILSGGTDNGATRSVLKLVEIILLVCKVLPQSSRPKLIYLGNAFLAGKIKEILKKWTNTATAPNVRPSLDVENITPNLDVLGNVLTFLRSQAIGGFENLARGCSTQPAPTSHATGKMVQFLSQINDPAKNVLAVDMGGNSTTLALANKGNLSLHVMANGMGKNIQRLAEPAFLEQMHQVTPFPFVSAMARDYLWQKSLYPDSVPMTEETYAVEQAAIRVILKMAAREALAVTRQEFLVAEPVLASGAPVCKMPYPGSSLLALLDGLQPAGVSTFILDSNNILASLGVIARVNAILPVQVLESNAFLNLGTIIAPVSRCHAGTHILTVTVEEETGQQTQTDILQGSLIILPVKMGQAVKVTLEAFNGALIDPLFDRRTLNFKILGGFCGIVVDARGRPLVLPKDPERRAGLYGHWFQALGITKGR